MIKNILLEKQQQLKREWWAKGLIIGLLFGALIGAFIQGLIVYQSI